MRDWKNAYKKLGQRSGELKPKASPHTSRKWLFFTFAFVIFIGGLGLGFTISAWYQATEPVSYNRALKLLNTSAPANLTSIDFDLFWNVWRLLKQKYLRQPINEQNLFYGAIAGMVASLGDPHSVFFDPEQSKQFLEEINGSFSGIGVEIGLKNDKLTVIAPLAGSPAEKAGLITGDVIKAIDGLETKFMTIDAAIAKIRGQENTVVALSVEREGNTEPVEMVITRQIIKVESVKLATFEEGGKKVLHITISQFSNDTGQKFEELAQKILLEKPTGLILDLRNNAGGYLEAANDVASHFLEAGQVIVRERSADGAEKLYTANGKTKINIFPVVILINKGSASASEIVAGALQDYQRALIIGEASFGKGTVQDLQTFSAGASLKLTIAEWLTPERKTIDEVGITPDVVVERTEEDFSQNRDPQLDAAKIYFFDPSQFTENYNQENEAV